MALSTWGPARVTESSREETSVRTALICATPGSSDVAGSTCEHRGHDWLGVKPSKIPIEAVPQNLLWSAGCWQSYPTLYQALKLGVGLFGRADMEPEPLAMVAHPLLFLPQVSGRYL